MSKSLEGIYRGGKIELAEVPANLAEETHVIITILEPEYDLRKHGIDEAQAADLRARLKTFAEDWQSPEMEIYDNYDLIKSDS